MTILDQVKKSQLSKQGKTTLTGIFEGVPANAAAVVRGDAPPRRSFRTPTIQSPIDATFNALPQPTYLDYMKAANRK